MSTPFQPTISPHPEFPDVLVLEDQSGARLYYLSRGLELYGPGRVVGTYSADHRYRVEFFQHLGPSQEVPVLLRVTDTATGPRDRDSGHGGTGCARR